MDALNKKSGFGGWDIVSSPIPQWNMRTELIEWGTGASSSSLCLPTCGNCLMRKAWPFSSGQHHNDSPFPYWAPACASKRTFAVTVGGLTPPSPNFDEAQKQNFMSPQYSSQLFEQVGRRVLLFWQQQSQPVWIHKISCWWETHF